MNRILSIALLNVYLLQSADILTANGLPENNYQTGANAWYWKNRKPYEGYWQQDVHYTIHAIIDESSDIIRGKERLKYFNNSPDTLYFVYFHLYQNAFQPGSYLDNLQLHNDVHVKYGKYEREKLGIEIDSLYAEGQKLKTETDNTIMKVWLPSPLVPGGQQTFDMQFHTYYDGGSTRRRMKKYRSGKFNHYNGCQWYPKITVYDHKFGWCTDQHLNREFYGDFGTFDVTLDFASNYVVEATGELLNEKEVLPDTLREKLDLKNFKDKVWDSPASEITPYRKGERKIWKYHAENVHDFAFTADPAYRIGEAQYKQVRCIAVVQEPHASGWQDAAAYTARIIQVFSEDFGMYEYPKMVVADAADGMEYPMITLDGGKDPDYRGLLIHEIGHNWFYGMLGNNETYRAMLDEGFTQFITSWGMEKLDGPNVISTPSKNKYVKRFEEPVPVRDSKVYYGYMQDAVRYADPAINTHSDGFNGALGQGGGYRHVYAKTATMLYNLQYVLGDSLFLQAMQHYVKQWKFCHPYPEDFRESIIRFTKADLNWFFDQWMETDKKIDYAVGKIKKGKSEDEYVVQFKRNGRMQMPIDFQIISKKGDTSAYYIPNTWFEKKTDATILPRWIGWDKLQPTYEARLKVNGGIRDIIIDPSNRLADINMLDNRKKQKPEIRFDSRIFPYPEWKKYRFYIRPDLWYNSYDGIKAGIHINGNYMNNIHLIHFSAWVNTHFPQGGLYEPTLNTDMRAGWFSYLFRYSTPTDRLFRGGTFFYESRWLDGYEMYRMGLQQELPKNFYASIDVKAFTRPKEAWRNYLLYPSEWDAVFENRQAFNTSVNAMLGYRYSAEKSSGKLEMRIRSSWLFSGFDYHYAEAEHINRTSFWKFDLRSRAYMRFTTGSSLPSESALFLAGENPEEMMENKYTRAAGWIPPSWVGTYGNSVNHFHAGGGLNLRGYAGYQAWDLQNNGQSMATYKGRSGMSVSAELDFNRLVPVKNKFLKETFSLNTYLFSDAGVISLNNEQIGKFRMDAGAGMVFTIKRFGPFQRINPLSIRCDFPFFLNRPPESEKYLQFRWVLGISRSF